MFPRKKKRLAIAPTAAMADTTLKLTKWLKLVALLVSFPEDIFHPSNKRKEKFLALDGGSIRLL